MRIPIGGSDFDLAPWAYNELPTHDANLSNFRKLDDRDLKRVILCRCDFFVYTKKKCWKYYGVLGMKSITPSKKKPSTNIELTRYLRCYIL